MHLSEEGPPDVRHLEKRLAERNAEVEAWIEQRSKEICYPVYSSFDLRDAGFKMSTIDANIYPAGFNNLCDSFLDRGAKLMHDFVTSSFRSVERIVIYPESHTRNKYYLQNLFSIKSIIERSGFQVLIGTADPKFPDSVTELETVDGQRIEIHKLVREGDLLQSDDFVPDLILINNDFSNGKHEGLIDVAQPMTPPPEMGWYVRSKWRHFQICDSLMKEFAEILEVDPWLLSPFTEFESEIVFKNGQGVDRVAKKVDYVLDRVAAKYEEFGIDRKPLVFIKDDSGTYGMGIIVVGSGEEVLNLNRSQRNKMSHGKGSSGIKAAIIQECIPTTDYYKGRPGEPVVYMVGDQVVGGFFRYSDSKSETESLNSPGTRFAALCVTDVNEFDEILACYHGHCSFSLYYTIARISCLAMGREMTDRELCPSTVHH